MTTLQSIDLASVGRALAAHGFDGWLLYDFHGVNPIARRVVGHTGMVSRRLFVWLPASGAPVAVAHRIELHGIDGFPGEVRPYASWETLHRLLGEVVRGKRAAMEVSPGDAVPYLDWVPHGVVEMVERLGGSVASSAPLVTEFAARLSEAEMREHVTAAEKIAEIARTTLREVVRQAGTARETAVQRRVLEAFDQAGLVTTHPPIVAFGSNAANPHYEPREGADALLREGEVVLLDLWAGTGPRSAYADQTWMGFAGPSVPDAVAEVWTTVRDARDAVVSYLRDAAGAGKAVTGADLDDQARAVIRNRGFGEYFVHRTGHSIDMDLHGSGPHLDNFETNDIREIVPGLAFSVEPGVYLEGRFGVRSEINVLIRDDGPQPTPAAPQVDLILGG